MRNEVAQRERVTAIMRGEQIQDDHKGNAVIAGVVLVLILMLGYGVFAGAGV